MPLILTDTITSLNHTHEMWKKADGEIESTIWGVFIPTVAFDNSSVGLVMAPRWLWSFRVSTHVIWVTKLSVPLVAVSGLVFVGMYQSLCFITLYIISFSKNKNISLFLACWWILAVGPPLRVLLLGLTTSCSFSWAVVVYSHAASPSPFSQHHLTGRLPQKRKKNSTFRRLWFRLRRRCSTSARGPPPGEDASSISVSKSIYYGTESPTRPQIRVHAGKRGTWVLPVSGQRKRQLRRIFLPLSRSHSTTSSPHLVVVAVAVGTY